MALDEPKEGDVTYNVDDFTFIMEDYIGENFQSITIDYSNSWLRKGFTIIPNGRVSSC